MARIKALSSKDHEKCKPDHKLFLATPPNAEPFALESCGKINWYLHMMKVKYGWQLDDWGEYNATNIDRLQKELGERNNAKVTEELSRTNSSDTGKESSTDPEGH